MGGERGRADQAHQEDGGVEDRHLEDERRGDRQAERPELAEARPVGPPEAAEEVIAAEFSVEDHDERQHAEHHGRGHGRRDAGAEQLQPRKAELAEDQAPGRDGVDDEADRAGPEPQSGRSIAAMK